MYYLLTVFFLTVTLCDSKYDYGYPARYAGFADANGDGKVDFCRFVCLKAACREREIQLCCHLQGSDDQYGYCSPPGLESGKSGKPAALVDANKDGRADFCRFLAPPENALSVDPIPYCRLAGPNGWTEDEIVFRYKE